MPDDKQQSADIVTRLVERLGLSTVLLLGGSWFGYREIVSPMAESYKKMVNEVAETNRLLQEEIVNNDKEDGERVLAITEAMARLESKIDKLLGNQ